MSHTLKQLADAAGKLRQQFPYLPRAFRLVRDAAGGLTLLWLAVQADTIHVMDSGRIVESGSHAELLAAQGRYEASWSKQMRGGVPE